MINEPDVWRSLDIHGLVHVLIYLPHSIQELGLEHFLKRGQFSGGHLKRSILKMSSLFSYCDLSAVFAFLQLLEQLTGSPDVPGQREAALHLRHGPVDVHHDGPVTNTRPFDGINP